jgi:hypothetical protein
VRRSRQGAIKEQEKGRRMRRSSQGAFEEWGKVQVAEHEKGV